MKECCPGVADHQSQPTPDTAGEPAPIAPSSFALSLGAQGDCCSGSGARPEVERPVTKSAVDASRHAAGDDCCSAKEQEIAALGAHADVKRILQIVLAINLAMFFVEFTAGILARSTALIALVANLTCLALLYRFRNRDVNMSSTFECSRNDVIANAGVLVAATGVYAFRASWPDIVVGSIIALLFFRSAIRVLGEAWPQFRSGRPQTAVPLD